MYTLTLSHRPNPDFANGGYPVLPNTSGKPETHEVETIEQARKLCETYRDMNALGGGNWSGGQIHDGAGELVGRIAYNGRYFDAVPS